MGRKQTNASTMTLSKDEATRRRYSAEEKLRIVSNGLKGEDDEPCRAIGPSDNGECGTVPA